MRITTSSAFPPPTPNLARHPASLATWIFQKPRLFRAEDMVVAFVQDGVANVQDRFARSIEEPLRDEALSNQRSDDLGNPLNGQNDLELISGALGHSRRLLGDTLSVCRRTVHDVCTRKIHF